MESFQTSSLRYPVVWRSFYFTHVAHSTKPTTCFCINRSKKCQNLLLFISNKKKKETLFLKVSICSCLYLLIFSFSLYHLILLIILTLHLTRPCYVFNDPPISHSHLLLLFVHVFFYLYFLSLSMSIMLNFLTLLLTRKNDHPTSSVTLPDHTPNPTRGITRALSSPDFLSYYCYFLYLYPFIFSFSRYQYCYYFYSSYNKNEKKRKGKTSSMILPDHTPNRTNSITRAPPFPPLYKVSRLNPSLSHFTASPLKSRMPFIRPAAPLVLLLRLLRDELERNQIAFYISTMESSFFSFFFFSFFFFSFFPVSGFLFSLSLGLLSSSFFLFSLIMIFFFL